MGQTVLDSVRGDVAGLKQELASQGCAFEGQMAKRMSQLEEVHGLLSKKVDVEHRQYATELEKLRQEFAGPMQASLAKLQSRIVNALGGLQPHVAELSESLSSVSGRV